MAVRKLRMNKPLTAADLAEVERMLAESGGGPEDIARARQVAEGLGLFVRSLVGSRPPGGQGGAGRLP